MKPNPNRRFEIADAMILVAAAAITATLVRHETNIGPALGRFANVYQHFFVDKVHKWAPSILVPMTLAALLIRLRRPRPALRRLVRQPGALATLLIITSMVASFALPVARYLIVGQIGIAPPWPSGTDLESLFSAGFSQGGPMVIGSWITLILSRRWRPAPDWIDRLGRSVGLAWVVLWLSQVLGNWLF